MPSSLQRHQQAPFRSQTNPTIALMVFQSTVPRAPEGSSAPVLHPQLNNKRSHHHHLTFPVLTSTLSRYHTEPIPPTPQDSARHPLRRPSPSPSPLHLNHNHDSGQPRSHKRHLDRCPTPLHARLQRLLPPRLLRTHRPHLSHHLSRPRRSPRPHSLLSLRCPRRPSRDYPFTR